MSVKNKKFRRARKILLSSLDELFDLERLDYQKRTKPLRDKSKLTGVLGAGAIYAVGFGVGYYAWKTGGVSYTNFAKLVWILMIPSSVMGVFFWMLSTNRKEYVVREDIRQYMSELEGDGGLLWRFIPLLSELKPDAHDWKQTLFRSKEGQLSEIAPDEYCAAVYGLYGLLQGNQQRKISAETAQEIEQNFSDYP
ncbi:MAG: hypothetical protein ACE5EH_11765 [Gammaproteobacteria bacterium]